MRELRTYTSLWGMEKRLYKFYDINLPYPISIKQIAFFIGTLIPWFFILNFLQVPFSNPWYVVWVVPPFAVAYFGNKPVAEGKKLYDYVFSQLGFFLSNKTYTSLKPSNGDASVGSEYHISCVAWKEHANRKSKKAKKKTKREMKNSKDKKSSHGTKNRQGKRQGPQKATGSQKKSGRGKANSSKKRTVVKTP